MGDAGGMCWSIIRDAVCSVCTLPPGDAAAGRAVASRSAAACLMRASTEACDGSPTSCKSLASGAISACSSRRASVEAMKNHAREISCGRATRERARFVWRVDRIARRGAETSEGPSRAGTNDAVDGPADGERAAKGGQPRKADVPWRGALVEICGVTVVSLLLPPAPRHDRGAAASAAPARTATPPGTRSGSAQ
eukprot:4988920-Prymnesium_polylepis.2